GGEACGGRVRGEFEHDVDDGACSFPHLLVGDSEAGVAIHANGGEAIAAVGPRMGVRDVEEAIGGLLLALELDELAGNGLAGGAEEPSGDDGPGAVSQGSGMGTGDDSVVRARSRAHTRARSTAIESARPHATPGRERRPTTTRQPRRASCEDKAAAG